MLRRIGLVGDEGGHIVALAEHWRAHPELGLGLAAVLDPTRDWGVPEARDVGELSDAVDAVVVMSRDGAAHLSQAEPFLLAGLDVFVDKPLATTVDDARALLRASREGGGRVTSLSTMRYQPGVALLRREGAGAARWRITGPADRRHPDGLAFYAIHAIELAMELAPGFVPEGASDDGEVVTLVGCAGGAEVDVRVAPNLPFSAAASLRGDMLQRSWELGDDYYRPAAERISGFLLGDDPPVEGEDLIGPVDALERMLAAIAADS